MVASIERGSRKQEGGKTNEPFRHIDLILSTQIEYHYDAIELNFYINIYAHISSALWKGKTLQAR